MDNRYEKAVLNIVNTQKQIIGPLALDMARRVGNMKIEGESVTITGNPQEVLKSLVREYEVLFGDLSVKVSRDSIKDINFSTTELPDILR